MWQLAGQQESMGSIVGISKLKAPLHNVECGRKGDSRPRGPCNSVAPSTIGCYIQAWWPAGGSAQVGPLPSHPQTGPSLRPPAGAVGAGLQRYGHHLHPVQGGAQRPDERVPQAGVHQGAREVHCHACLPASACHVAALHRQCSVDYSRPSHSVLFRAQKHLCNTTIGQEDSRPEACLTVMRGLHWLGNRDLRLPAPCRCVQLIGFCHMRIADGVGSRLQLSGLLADLCQATMRSMG